MSPFPGPCPACMGDPIRSESCSVCLPHSQHSPPEVRLPAETERRILDRVRPAIAADFRRLLGPNPRLLLRR